EKEKNEVRDTKAEVDNQSIEIFEKIARKENEFNALNQDYKELEKELETLKKTLDETKEAQKKQEEKEQLLNDKIGSLQSTNNQLEEELRNQQANRSPSRNSLSDLTSKSYITNELA